MEKSRQKKKRKKRDIVTEKANDHKDYDKFFDIDYKKLDREVLGTFKSIALGDFDFNSCVRCKTTLSFSTIGMIKYFVKHYHRKKYIATTKIVCSALFKLYDIVEKYDISNMLGLMSQVEVYAGGVLTTRVSPIRKLYRYYDVENWDFFRFFCEKQASSIADTYASNLNMSMSTFYSYALPIGVGFYDEFRNFLQENIREPVPKAYKRIGEDAFKSLETMLHKQYHDYFDYTKIKFRNVKNEVKKVDSELYDKIVKFIEGN